MVNEQFIISAYGNLSKALIAIAKYNTHIIYKYKCIRIYIYYH